MKKTSAGPDESGDLQPEYELDYRESKPNRFASRIVPGGAAVVLDPDVASVFKSSQAVNDLLRAVIGVLPKPS